MNLKHVHVITVEGKEVIEGLPDIKGMWDNVMPEKPN